MSKPYPAIRYAELIPIDTSANPFALSVTHFVQDSVGQAKFINGKGDDVPLVNVKGTKFEQMVNMAGVGYSFSLEEIGAAQMMGSNLSADGADAARLAYEQLVDEVAFVGNTALGVQGLYNMTGITTIAAGATFAASTPSAILAIINNAMNEIHSGSLGVEMADTVVLPLAELGRLASTPIGDSGLTVLGFLKAANVYTVSTGQPLNIIGDRRLATQMVVYRKDPAVLKLHMPMPLQFIPPQAVNLEIKVLGMFRFAPISIRRPGAVRYVSGVAA
ncbi:MAG: DUF2184 domain-containing protein [Cypionkella sp.]|nr:DUF2184 domain-containing protein [Cypionkella sp.]